VLSPLILRPTPNTLPSDDPPALAAVDSSRCHAVTRRVARGDAGLTATNYKSFTAHRRGGSDSGIVKTFAVCIDAGMSQPSTRPTLYKGYRLPPEIIRRGVWLYYRFG